MSGMEFEIRTVQVHDTGIGQEAGFKDDDELIEAATAEREAALSLLTPEARERLERAEAAADRKLLFGE